MSMSTGWATGADGRSEIAATTSMTGDRIAQGASAMPEDALRGEAGAITLPAAVAGYARRTRAAAERIGAQIPTATWCHLVRPLPDVRTAGHDAHAEAREAVHRTGVALVTIRLLSQRGGRVQVQVRVIVPRLTERTGRQQWRVWELAAKSRTMWDRDRLIDAEIRHQGYLLAQEIARLEPVVPAKKKTA